ncbi:MAG: hydrogen peroxide-inducible genes activator [Wenzhouxiangellaceae bacterium]
MRNNKPTIRQIEYFVGIAESDSYRRAADRLGVSQPTLTAQMSTLEQTLGVTLFERSRSGIDLTPLGRELLINARRVLEEVRALTDAAESASRGPAGTHRLGVPPTVGPYFLPHVVPQLHRKYFALQFYVRENAPYELEADLLEGRLDLILSPLPMGSRELMVEELFEEPLLLVVPSDHPFAERESIDHTALRGQKVLTLEARHHYYRQVHALCERFGAYLLRDYEGTSLDTLRQMVSMGMGLAFLPAIYIHSEIHDRSDLHILPLKGTRISRSVALVYRPTSPNRHLYRQLAAEMRTSIASSLNRVVNVRGQ